MKECYNTLLNKLNTNWDNNYHSFIFKCGYSWGVMEYEISFDLGLPCETLTMHGKCTVM